MWLHVGRENKEFNYSMKGLPLVEITQERDIGVLINKNLKPSSQCAEASRRANAVLGQVSRAFLYRDCIILLKLYTQIVRCHLKFAVHIWSPWSIADIDILEKVQKQAVNLITGLVGKSYKEKLVELGNILT